MYIYIVCSIQFMIDFFIFALNFLMILSGVGLVYFGEFKYTLLVYNTTGD